MALQPTLTSPLGLLALLGLVPLIILYFIRPDPTELRLPTTRFLVEDSDEGGQDPVLRRITQWLLLLLQALVVLALAVSLAGPSVSTTEQVSAASTLIVVDGSASMGTQTSSQTGTGTRFAAAVDIAKQATSGETTVLFSGAAPRVVAANATSEEARAKLDELRVTDAPGDLRSAISQATSRAGAETRLLVISDFADSSDWRAAIAAAQARGLDVSIRQVSGGGTDNVGIVGQQFTNQRVTFSVKNTGTEPAERTVRFDNRTRRLQLQPGDVATATFSIPPGGARAVLEPRDSVPADDVASVGAPVSPTVDVLLLTNDGNRNLRTALQVMDTVNLTVRNPPAPITDDYDVVVFGRVDRERLLDSTLATTREMNRDGSGVVVQARPDLETYGYGSLLPMEPTGVQNTTGVGTVAESELTRGFEFSAPDRHVTGSVRNGRAVVELADGSPLLATGQRGSGRVLYYGYMPSQSSFDEEYRYPVFWKRAIFWAADRDRLPEYNYETGARLQFDNTTTVRTPTGERRTDAVRLGRAGFYVTADRRVGASLLRPDESNVTTPSVASVPTDWNFSAGPTTQQVSRDLTPLLVALALLVLLGEVAYLRWRGDL
jgi:hypothetical protein